MATGKALNGKPYAGNPHVRFDEGEVASAATSRRGSLLYKHCVVVVAAVVCGLLNAEDGWSRRAVEENAQGDAAKNASIGYAAYVAGYRYAHGKGVERNLEKALEWYLVGAEAGYVKAEASVGTCCWNGEGTGRDYGEAAYWFERAALHGDAHSIFAMGIMRHLGLDGNTNCYEACQWFRAAAQNGYGNPGYEPDVIEEEGCGPEVSVYWIASAAESGNRDALYWLTVCCRRGQGVPCDKQMAQSLMEDAAEAGHSLAKCIVGCEKWYGRISGSRSEGLELVREAEKQGSITAYKHLEKLDKTGSL